MTKRLVFSILLGAVACDGESLTVDLSSATVELDVFSGLPNPQWQLSTQEIGQLEGRFRALPETNRVEIPGHLGYRGFHIHDESGTTRITVTNNGYVVFHRNRRDKFYRDTKGIEDWLKARAHARGYARLLTRAH